MSEKVGKKIGEGKTKKIWEIPGTSEVLIESNEAITAGDGTRRDEFPGKGSLATKTTANSFSLLNRAGIPNHFIKLEGDNTFRAEKLRMIPIELVARRLAYGSYLKRNPEAVAGTKFSDIEFEMFSKDDPNEDPFIVLDFDKGTIRRHNAKLPVSEETLFDEVPITESVYGISEDQLIILRQLTEETFGVLEAAWADLGVTLVDIKIEAGFTEAGGIVVGDVIDNDNWRIWPDGDPSRMMDKQLYRDGHPISDVAESYLWVADATNSFA